MKKLFTFILCSLFLNACGVTLPPINVSVPATLPPIVIDVPTPSKPVPPPVPVVPPTVQTGAVYVTIVPMMDVSVFLVGDVGGRIGCGYVSPGVYLCNPTPVGTYSVFVDGVDVTKYTLDLATVFQVTVVADRNVDAKIIYDPILPPAPPAPPVPPPSTSTVLFDHPWSGKVESAFHDLLASGLAGIDGQNGQAVVDKLNAMGGIYAGAEFQHSHNGNGYPTYGFPWFYVSYINDQGAAFYQIVEFGTSPVGD